MSKNELITKIEALQEWEAIMEDAKAEAEALRDSIKEEMLRQGTEEMEAGTYIIRWTSVLTNRFDTTAFKKEHNDIYLKFTKQIQSKRFSIGIKNSGIVCDAGRCRYGFSECLNCAVCGSVSGFCEDAPLKIIKSDFCHSF